MKKINWLNLLIKYRLIIGIVMLAIGAFVNVQAGFWPAFVLYLIAAILIAGHFLFGPLRLVESYMQEGDIEGAKKVVDGIMFPKLLIKPMRSMYYTLKGHLAMAEQDFDSAEKHMKQGVALGGGQLTAAADGPNKLQLGMLAMQKGNWKEGESYIREAIRAGFPDADTKATAYLQMSSIMMRKREFRAGKEMFRKAKNFKPTNPQILEQIKKLERDINRMPG